MKWTNNVCGNINTTLVCLLTCNSTFQQYLTSEFELRTMPFGQLSISNRGIPQHDPPYSDATPVFDDVTVLTIQYRTSFKSISHLIPDVIEVENEPLVTATLLNYGAGPAGPFLEFIHTVEAKYLGKSYDFCLSLILDNEMAVLAGREPCGFPKRLGQLSLTTRSSNRATGYVERPVGQKLVEFSFEGKQSKAPHQTLIGHFWTSVSFPRLLQALQRHLRSWCLPILRPGRSRFGRGWESWHSPRIVSRLKL